MEYRIDDLLDEYFDASVSLDTMAYTSADTIKEMTVNKINNQQDTSRRMGHKRVFTVALAAALVFALSITAFAAYSIHQRRQEELRNMLMVDENQIGSYVEYDATDGNGVTLLSAIRDGDIQKLYVNIFPVTEEEAIAAVSGGKIFFTTNHTDGYGSVDVPYDKMKLPDEGDETYDFAQIQELSLRESYDAEAKTLTVCLNLWEDSMNGSEPVAVTVVRMDDGLAKLHTYGTVTITPTAADTREIRFTEPVELYNESQRDNCRVVGVRLTAMSAEWMLEITNAEELFVNKNLSAQQQEELLSWLNCIDVLGEAVLIMNDGSEHSTDIIVSDTYENGLVISATASWATTIDIEAVVGVRIQDTTAA